MGVTPPNKETNKMIKFSFEPGGFFVSPVYEKDLNSRIRVFTHVIFRGEESGSNQTTLNFGVLYGYRLKIM